MWGIKMSVVHVFMVVVVILYMAVVWGICFMLNHTTKPSVMLNDFFKELNEAQKRK